MNQKITCPNCDKVFIPILQRPKGDERPIQQIWPTRPAWMREQLISGICSEKCWSEFLGMEGDDNGYM